MWSGWRQLGIHLPNLSALIVPGRHDNEPDWSEWRQFGVRLPNLSTLAMPGGHNNEPNWSGRRQLRGNDKSVVRRSTREEPGGIGMEEYHTPLIQGLPDNNKPDALARVLLHSLTQEEYEELRRELLEVDEEAMMKILTGTSCNLYLFFVY